MRGNEVKLLVIRCDGRREEISITTAAVVERNPGSPLWVIRNGDSCDHYFTLDGHYDGWGMGLAGHEVSPVEAGEIIQAVESARRVEPEHCACGHSRGRHITAIHGRPLGKCAAPQCKCKMFSFSQRAESERRGE